MKTKHLLKILMGLLFFICLSPAYAYEYSGTKTINATVGDVITLDPFRDDTGSYSYYQTCCYSGGFGTIPEGLQLTGTSQISVSGNYQGTVVKYDYKCTIKCLKSGTYTVVHTVYADSKYRNIATNKPQGIYYNKLTYTIYVKALAPTSVSLPSTRSVEVGSTTTLTPTLLPELAETTYSWTSSNHNVATVSGGEVKGVSKGKTTITVTTANGKTASCEVTVNAASPSSVTLPTQKTLEIGETTTFAATVSPSYAEYTLTWSSDDENVAKVSQEGVVTTVGTGTANITVQTNNGRSASCKVIVLRSATSITLPETASVFEDETITLTPTLLPANTTSKITSWLSDDTSIATVSADGAVTGVSEGTAVVTVQTDNGLSASCTVTVKPIVKSVSLPAECSVILGGTTMLTATVTPSNAEHTLAWTSDDESIAKVSKNGEVTALNIGSANISVETNNGKTATCKVTVVQPATSITLPETVSVFEDESITLTPTLQPENTTSKITSWLSDDTSVATVSADGVVTGIKAGTAVITTTTDNGLSASCTVTVKIVPPTSISFPSDKITMEWQGTMTLTPIITPDNATTTLNWRSDNEAIATVSQDGVVTGKEVGTATIIVETYNGLSATCEVVVEPWADGTYFTEMTNEGLGLRYKVLSGKDRTCAVASDQYYQYYQYYQNHQNISWSITIPSMAKGFSVVSIDEKAFYECDGLTSVTIPESVTSIGYEAFAYCI